MGGPAGLKAGMQAGGHLVSSPSSVYLPVAHSCSCCTTVPKPTLRSSAPLSLPSCSSLAGLSGRGRGWSVEGCSRAGEQAAGCLSLSQHRVYLCNPQQGRLALT